MQKLLVSCAAALIACGGEGSSNNTDAGDPDASGDPDAVMPDGPPMPVAPGADPTFGSGGLATVGFPGALAAVMRIARQADGKIVGVGGTQESLMIVRVGADGSFDSTFGNGGVVHLPWGVATNGVMVGYGCAIQSDGKIVAAARVIGSYQGLGSVEVVVRLLADGSLDTSFAGTGYVVGNPYTSATSLALQGDGKIVVGGYARLERFLTDGTRDMTFGTAGVATPNLTVQDLVLQPDGKIVVIGAKSIARFGSTGAIDTTFGTNGITTVTSLQGYDALYAITQQTDGKLLVGGAMTTSGNQQGFWIGRYSADGVLDTTFATTGFVTGDPGTGGVAFGVGVDANGKIAGSGYTTINGNAGRSARYEATGAVDTTFGTQGVGALYQDVLFSNLVLEPSGAIVAAGAGFLQGNPGYAIALTRTTATGAADPAFGTSGEAKKVVSGSFDRAHAVAFQSDGKLLVGGWAYTGGGAAIVRLHNDGALDTTFGMGGRITGSQNLIYVNSLAVQPTGKILVGGLSGYSGSPRKMAVERYDAAGMRDMTFGTAGVGGGTVFADRDALGLAMTQATDGTIYVIGQTTTASSATEYGVLALTPDGAPLATFGSNGAAMTAFGTSYNIATHAVAQPDGAVVVLGQSGQGVALVRFTAAGVLDATFGTRVVATNMLPFGLTLQPDGAIVVVAGNYTTGAMQVARFTSSGAADPAFATGGVFAKTFAGNDYYGLYAFMGLVVLPNGKLQVGLASATTDGLREHGVFLRLNSDGTPDTAFAPDGVATVAIGRGSTSIHALVIDAAGKLVAVGRTWLESSGSSELMALRFNL